MRAILAALGILISAPVLLFFWVGTQTFVREHERLLAVAMTFLAGLLLVCSITLIFSASVQRIQSVLLAVTVAILAMLYVLLQIGR
jgi:hypothetical protein